MKKIILFMTTLFVSAVGFAGAATLSKTTLSSALRSKSHSGIQLNHDVSIVYAGQDLSEKHVGVEQLAIA